MLIVFQFFFFCPQTEVNTKRIHKSIVRDLAAEIKLRAVSKRAITFGRRNLRTHLASDTVFTSLVRFHIF